MKIIRKISKVLLPKKIELTSIDGTGLDSWQRSRHYEKRAEELSIFPHLPHMPYAKADIFIDVKTQSIIDFSLITHREHDVKVGERIFKRNNIKNIIGLGDKGYDSENLHEIARANGITFYAPVRKMDKRGFSDQKPGGFYRRKCVKRPEFYGMRGISETVNSVIKRRQISALRSKKCFMKQREFGWHVILYNIRRKLIVENNQQSKIITQTFFCLVIIIYPFRTEHNNKNI